MLTATNPLLCNMTVMLLWKCNEIIVTQQELLRYYSNATKDLTCHNITACPSSGPLLVTKTALLHRWIGLHTTVCLILRML
jgi:hypothetical protein